MAFKTVKQFNEDRYHDMLMLKDDGDFVDVIFLYRDIDDVLIADAHYIKSPEFQGYVHCLGGKDCPACNHGKNGIRIDSKLFIPVYVVSGDDKGKILFWDRNSTFNQIALEPQVFSKYPNPSEFVFRITRQGERGDWNTKFIITAVGKNTIMSYDEILKSLDVTMPDYYETICKNWDSNTYKYHLNYKENDNMISNDDIDSMPEYTLSARNITTSDLPSYDDFNDDGDEESTVKVDF